MSKENTDNNRQNVTVESIRTSYELWANESIVKTEKLTLFFIAQSVLLTGFTLGNQTGQVIIAVIGMAFSALMFISIGRTDAYQIIWEKRVRSLVEDASEPVSQKFDLYPEDEEIKNMPWYKQTTQSYIHYPPLAGFVIWILLFILFAFSLIS